MSLHLSAATCLAGILCLICCSFVQGQGSTTEQRLESLEKFVELLGQQIRTQQFMNEERARHYGKSGLKVIRGRSFGTKNYHLISYASHGAAGIHEHSNNIRTVGMSEFSAVLNGIDFKTRHNDYRLYMPSNTSMEYGAMQEVPFPDVPPEVLNEPDVTKASERLKEYFKAWRDQNKSHVDYTPYFKPVLCYMEGAWTISGDEIEEPFFSDRHSIDATSWLDLQQKVRFAAYTGAKSQGENFATLPSAIMEMVNSTTPVYAQFNYRIMCHPLKKDVPLNRFKIADDLAIRVGHKNSIFQHERSRAARFTLSPENGKFIDGIYMHGLLDELMEEIPGRNNYPGYFEDDGVLPAYELENDKKKDVSRYNRVYRIQGTDATGVSSVIRGFNDDFMFAAMTNHTKIAPITFRKKTKQWANGKPVYTNVTQRWTYAIPLEIIYLTPLNKWNPYNLEYKGESESPEGLTVTANGQTGECKAGKQLQGTNSKLYYNTPAEFFEDSHTSKSTADTSLGTICVLDGNGVERKVKASGVHVFLPHIPGVGALRTRYPIFPIHDEGSSTWKEVEALKQLVMDKNSYGKYYWNASNEDESGDFYYETAPSTKWNVVSHIHTITLSSQQVNAIKLGVDTNVTTSSFEGHDHRIEVYYDKALDELAGRSCDGKAWSCPDGHKLKPLIRINTTQV